MRVTDVKVEATMSAPQPGPSGECVVAFAKIILDGRFVVDNIRVVEWPDGQRKVNMPSRRTKTGDIRDVAYAAQSDLRQEIREAVLAAVAKA